MTLIELMIALLIGAFLLTGISQIFIGSKQTNRMQENLSRLQENGRFSLNLISQDIRRAGFQGCPSLRSASITTNTAAGIPTLSANTAVSGSDGASGDSINLIYADSCDANLTTTMVDVSTAIQINNSNTCSINANEALLVSNCNSVDIFRATNNGTPVQHAALNNVYGIDAELFNYHDYTYSIANNNWGGRSLWRRDNAQLNPSSVELIEGVENMQILFGIDTDDDDDADATTSAPDGPANYYVSPGNVPDLDLDGTVDWYRVVSIRISLLVATIDNNLTAQAQTYTFNGVTTTPTDRRIRRVFTTTVTLRNRLP